MVSDHTQETIDGLQAGLETAIQQGKNTEQAANHRLETLEHDGQVLADKADQSEVRQDQQMETMSRRALADCSI